VTSKIWAYVKENNLQNPSDKREILLDEALKKVFKVNKVTMFSMNKYLVKHIYPIEEES
jgi:upstream activation factor subunit UAF30